MSKVPDAPIRRCLDTEDGLGRLMGKRALYREILQRFQRDHLDVVQRMTQMLHAGERLQAQREAHLLKGSAGLIGAQQVHDLTVLLENAIAAGTETHSLLPFLGDALKRLGVAIERVLPDLPEQEESADAEDTTENLHELLHKLAFLLNEGDGAAIDLVEQRAGVLAAALGVKAYEAVAAAAHAFDFETALDALYSAR
ncbi:Hpt domain-containing protein [Pseudoduganella sp. RAF53_2]|jgi:HPt (histidine-containing phosphotransfer) domain-containing protein|uniref:Hpt domain-containing protein n=1 Tax=unclassified Pseudoduganella TaxID=2637179 RepID=UPI003F98948F